ncbi:MAG: hypothetical protein U0232_01810 [Thermomicrobiales bacterium]
MSTVLDEVLSANRAYASDFGDKGSLPMPPGRRFAIRTCMDARLDPARYAGLSEGDAHVIPANASFLLRHQSWHLASWN